MPQKRLGAFGILIMVVFLISGVIFASTRGIVNKGEDYFPLQSGNKWSYQVTAPGDIKYEQVMVVGKQEADLVKLGVLAAGQPQAEIYFKIHEKGLFKVKEVTQNGIFEYTPPQPVLAADLSLGVNWRWESKNKKIKDQGVVKAKERIKVPAGSFETICILSKGVDAAGNAYTDKAWYAKNVGLVKEEFNTGKEKMVQELVKYQVNQK